MKSPLKPFLITVTSLLFTSTLNAEEIEKGVEQLQDITVEATRVEKSLYEIPASVGAVTKDDIQYGRQQLGLDESLNKVPGIFMQNRYNFNQDLSISIRGFGARGTFGIRGVKVYVDGIPNTLPDGQGGIDSIDIGSINRMEVIRGPSSSLYGTAAGGVINIYTEDGPAAAPYVEGRVTTGTDNYNQVQLKAGGQKNALNYFISAQRLGYEGYRDHSEIERYNVNSKFRYDIDSTSDFTLTANILHKPEAEDPGGLCSPQTATAFCTTFDPDRTVAQRNNVRFDAGESVDQQQFGLTYRKLLNNKHEIIARNYYQFRQFDANLPFGDFSPLPATSPDGGIVDLDRVFIGGGLQYSYSDQFFGRSNRLTIGADIDSQMDERKNYTNVVDSPVVGPLSLDQDEDVFSWGIYIQDEFNITDNLQLTAGGRYDEVEFEFTDKFLSNGDQSGSVTFDEFSPQVGLLYKFNESVNIYGAVSTSFETPSTREFAAPGSGAGFNTSIDSQTSTNYEVGIKGLLPLRASYQISIFSIDTEDEIFPIGENGLGSIVFDNVGDTTRNGLEAALSFSPLPSLPGLNVSLAYTYSDFEFDKLIVSGMSFAGEKIPGTPEHFGYAEISYYAPSGFYSAFDIQYVDEIFVNNAYIDDPGVGANLIPQGETTKNYAVANLRFGWTYGDGSTEITPFVGISNLFNKEYIGNIRINEARHRYFEPAPERNLFAGISLKY